MHLMYKKKEKNQKFYISPQIIILRKYFKSICHPWKVFIVFFIQWQHC